MKSNKSVGKSSLVFKYILFFILPLCTISSEVLIRQNNLSIQLTISSIFILLIIGLSNSRVNLPIITLLNCTIFFIDGFNILTCVQALEIFFVWFLYNTNKMGRIKGSALRVLEFWIIVALPIIYISSYIANPRLNIQSTFFILLIFMNRVFNAVIADMLLDFIPFEKMIYGRCHDTRVKTLSNLLAYACIVSIVAPTIIFIIATNLNNQRQISEMATRDLKTSSEYINEKVNSWTEEEKNNLKLKNPVQVYKLIDMLKMYTPTTAQNSVDFYLIDLDNKVITNNNSAEYMIKGLEWLKKGTITEVSADVYKWTAPRENTFIIKNYFTESAFLYVTKVDDLKVIMAVSSMAYNNGSIEMYLGLLKILIPLSLFVGVFVIALKRIILNSISKLIGITSGLPEKLQKNEAVIFERTNIAEIDSLTGNFQTMVDNLSNMITNIEVTNKKLKESEKMLFHQAHYDSLTGLPNRHYFIKYVKEVMDNFYVDEVYADKQGIAFFFLDLDKFKTVNDTFGHSAGDALLREIANRMNNILKNYNSASTFIGRLGGDEFVIEFIYEDKEEITKLANAIIEAINKPMLMDNNKITPGTSLGISLYPEDGKDIESIFIKSDTSMYKAKQSGGNTFSFYS